jgi:uncharacterized membrane protein YoaK (UPF0700 family)
MTNCQPNDKITSYALLGMTAVTGIIDGVSFLPLGRVFAANTGIVAPPDHSQD